MLVTYKTASTVLLTRPQTDRPQVGEQVVLCWAGAGAVEQHYRVVGITTRVRISVPARDYYSLIDAADEHVEVLLERWPAEQEV